MARWLTPSTATRSRDDLAGLNARQRAWCRPTLSGIDTPAKVDLAARILHALGLDHDLPPLVLLVGHGSQSVNNAHAASLDCDACCGQTGEVNARALASILNEPAVRAGLADRGVVVPERTVFVAALHVTTMDEIEWFDLDLLPPSVRPEWGAPGCTRIGGAWLVAPVASGGRANQPLLIQRLGSFGSWNPALLRCH